MSDTPRTDRAQFAAIPDAGRGSRFVVEADFSRTLERELAETKAQIPDEMKHCTILFKQCALGHGWLTATNWVQQGCPTCKTAEADRDKLQLQFALEQSEAANALSRRDEATVVVPREPTDEMLRAGWNAYLEEMTGGLHRFAVTYAAMLAAAQGEK